MHTPNRTGGLAPQLLRAAFALLALVVLPLPCQANNPGDALVVLAAKFSDGGTLTCSGAVHDGRLSGAFDFVPDPAFAGRMFQMGYRDLDEEKLQAYALFRIGIAWVRSLQAAGVSGMDSGNLIALRIFHADTDYVTA